MDTLDRKDLSTYSWHAMNIEEVLHTLDTREQGLSKEEATRRLQEFGSNELREEKRVTPLSIFLGQFKSILIIILILSAVISGYIDVYIEHELPIDMYVIAIIIVMNAILGFLQEYRAEKAVEALKRMIAPTAAGMRDGTERQVPSKELVPGDIIFLDEGVQIPADSRLIETVSLKVNEAPLTGESVPVDKSTRVLAVDASLTDRGNMAFMGTSVAYGRAKAVVTATGMNTSFGKIAEAVQAVDVEDPPLKVKVEHLGRQLAAASLIFTILIFVVGFLVHSTDLTTLFMTAISMAVSAIPEGLPAVITITLALGVGRMARNKSIVRKLASVETLGSTTVICSDKTGTLTKGEMTVRKLFVDGNVVEVTGAGYEPKGEFVSAPDKLGSVRDEVDLSLLLRIGVLCNNARLEEHKGSWRIYGDPTEGALVVAATKAGMWREDLEKVFVRVGEVPFSSERKRMTTVHDAPGAGRVAYMKGAPEIILDRCNRIFEEGRENRLTETRRRELLEVNENMAGNALRVLGMAYKTIPATLTDFTDDAVETDLVFVGLQGMIDPPRDEVTEANKLCEQAGIKTVMVTGDHKLTAMAIAKEIGMLKTGSLALTGVELNKIGDEELSEIVDDVSVYARVSPEHKMRIVNALKSREHIVAMTGDGVNDAPAIKAADIGIAMGITGTDVTKEASDMILEDDNFATIVTAVEGGRHIFDNIKKYLRLMITSNFDEFFQIIIAFIAGLPLPLIPTQILWINLVTDGLPAVALSIDPKNPELMQRHPRDPKEGILRRLWRFISFGAALDLLANFIPYLFILTSGFTYWGPWGLNDPNVIRARTAAFSSIVFFEFFLAYNSRSETHSVLQSGWKSLFSNKLLFFSVSISILIQIPIIYVPFLNTIFTTAPLSGIELILCFAGAFLALLIFPGKLISRQRSITNQTRTSKHKN